MRRLWRWLDFKDKSQIEQVFWNSWKIILVWPSIYDSGERNGVWGEKTTPRGRGQILKQRGGHSSDGDLKQEGNVGLRMGEQSWKLEIFDEVASGESWMSSYCIWPLKKSFLMNCCKSFLSHIVPLVFVFLFFLNTSVKAWSYKFGCCEKSKRLRYEEK